MAGEMSVVDDVRARLAWFDQRFGPDGDCGESSIFVTVNAMREILARIPADEAASPMTGAA